MFRRSLILSALVLTAGTAANAQEQGNRLNLACVGGGSANKPTSAQAYGWNSNGEYGSANVVGTKSVPFEDQLNLWVEGGVGRVRLPRTLLPPVHGGDDGWLELKAIKVTDDTITGVIGINFMNKPRLLIDRRTGHISVSGKSGDFAGSCSKFDPKAQERAF